MMQTSKLKKGTMACRRWIWGLVVVLAFGCILETNAAPTSSPTISPKPSPIISPSPPPPPPIPAAAPAPAILCGGVVLTYQVSTIQQIYPIVSNSSIQPYSFAATATITNEGYSELKNWQMGLEFQHQEVLVSLSNAILSDGTPMPALVGNASGILISGFPSTDVKTSIETAGDVTQIQTQIGFVGTEFGVNSSGAAEALPKHINLTNPGYKCGAPIIYGQLMEVCCVENSTIVQVNPANQNLPLEVGNISIFYDVLTSYDANYVVQVTIENDSPIGRLDHWNLAWQWNEGEFINTIQGAQATTSDQGLCLYGKAASQYTSGTPDLNQVASCNPKPHIVDLPRDRYNTSLGGIPGCCRNGTILPKILDPSQAQSVFKMNVYKLNPNLNRTHLVPPTNWQIDSGNQTGTYTCGNPRLVTPTVIPDPSGLVHETEALRSWQITCNFTQTTVNRPKKCCVSFSTYNNDSIIPCKTCACGCPANQQKTCNANASALLLPYEALTIAPENRTAKAVAWASIIHQKVSYPLPCPDNCGVSINWHIVSDYTNGWSARMTVFDWGTETYANWFIALDLGMASDGLLNAYSFNTTKVPDVNNTYIVQGLSGFSDYLNGAVGVYGATNYSSGKEQSVFAFTKATTPGFTVANEFPKQVWFNGEECSLPDYFPTSGAFSLVPSARIGTLLLLFVAILFGPFGFL